MIVVDTSGVFAALDDDQPDHLDSLRSLRASHPRILSPLVLAELDYLLMTRAGQRAELRFLDDVAQGVYQLVEFGPADVAAANDLIRRYSDLNLGLTDASVVVLAERYQCLDLLTLDQRHFRTVLGPGGRPFRLHPLDSA